LVLESEGFNYYVLHIWPVLDSGADATSCLDNEDDPARIQAIIAYDMRGHGKDHMPGWYGQQWFEPFRAGIS